MAGVDSVRDRLMRDDAHYRRLAHKHDEYEQRLAELRSRKFPSDEERAEEVKVKKLKLRVKDEMESIARLADEADPASRS